MSEVKQLMAGPVAKVKRNKQSSFNGEGWKHIALHLENLAD